MELKPKGGNYKVFVNRCKQLSIELPKEETFVMKEQTQKEIRQSTTDEEIKTLCAELYSRRHVLCRLGLYPEFHSNVDWSKKKILQLNIATDYWTGQAHLKGKTNDWVAKTDINQLMDKSYTNTSNLKNRLIKEGYLANTCANCNIINWCNQELSLHLDHIDGDNTNNKLDNLRLLCPNCHSLTDTYCGKNKNKK